MPSPRLDTALENPGNIPYTQAMPNPQLEQAMADAKSDPLVEILIRDFNTYRALTKSYAIHMARGIPPYKLPKGLPTYQTMSTMLAWCRARGVEPRMWLYTLFHIRKWQFPPKYELNSLCNEANIPRMKTVKGLGFFRGQLRVTPEEDPFDPNVDISPATEARKRTYLQHGNAAMCMDNTTTETWGYHPLSNVCAQCPLRGPCAVNLQTYTPFDVIGLRQGKVTKQAARRAALEALGASVYA